MHIHDNGVIRIEYTVEKTHTDQGFTQYKDGWMYCSESYFEGYIGKGSDRHYRKVTERKCSFISAIRKNNIMTEYGLPPWWGELEKYVRTMRTQSKEADRATYSQGWDVPEKIRFFINNGLPLDTIWWNHRRIIDHDGTIIFTPKEAVLWEEKPTDRIHLRNLF